MNEIYERTQRLIGSEKLEVLKNSHVAVFGIGGVGSASVEALARAGVGTLSLFDSDCVSKSNINRQLIATLDTVGTPKVTAAKERIAKINPDIKVFEHNVFYTADNSKEFDFSGYDYIIDAIDTVSSKIELILKAQQKDVKIISCMGTGNKLDPTRFEVCDIFKTSVCPLARVMRRELSKRGVKKLKVLYSKEEALTPVLNESENEKRVPASISFVPAVAGMILAGEVIRDLIGED